MTDEQLNEIEARANAATPGPWNANEIPYDGRDDPCITTESGIYIAQTTYDMQSVTQNHNIDADTEFIAHSRQDVLALLAEVKRLRG